MPKEKKKSIQQAGKRAANKQVPARAPMTPVNSASHGLTKSDPFNAEKCRRDIKAFVSRSLQEQKKQLNVIMVTNRVDQMVKIA